MNTPFVEKPKTKLRAEIDTLINEGGGYLSPHRMVEWAREHPESTLHKRFQWDDKKAADAYRLSQARHLIRVHVEQVAESGAKVRAFVSLERHRMPDEGYQALRSVLDDPLERRLLVEQAKRELQRWREKYGILEELQSIVEAIEKGGGAAA